MILRAVLIVLVGLVVTAVELYAFGMERRRSLDELYAVAVRVDHHAGCEEGSECLGLALHELSDALVRVSR